MTADETVSFDPRAGGHTPLDAGRPTERVPTLGRRFAAFMKRRIPPARSVRLNQRSVFILPSGQGLAYTLLLALLLVAAINYQNSLMFAFTFLLGSAFSAAIWQTFINLAGLQVESLGVRPAFAGRRLEYRFRLESPTGRPHIALQLGWPGASWRTAHVPAGGSVDVVLLRDAAQRGIDTPGRLRVETTFPLGLLRAWSWLDMDVRGVVWPRPLEAATLRTTATDVGSAAVRRSPDGEDLWGLRDYQPGDSPRRVAWKQYARRDQLLTRDFEQPEGHTATLDYDAVPGDVETRLSVLCGQVLAHAATGRDFTLRLPGGTFGPAHGEAHVEACLTALALHGTGIAVAEAMAPSG